MHRARLIGGLFALVGVLATVAILWLPAWLPIPRLFVIGSPMFALLGSAMLIMPGSPIEGEFDFEDWFDECSLGETLHGDSPHGVRRVST